MRTLLLATLGALAAACNVVNPTVAVVEPTTLRAKPPAPPPATRGAIWSDAARPLFEDVRARHAGDTLTVNIAEKLSASQKTSSNAEKTGSNSFSVPTIQGLPGKSFQGAALSADSSNKHDAKGETASDNLFTGTITVTVIEVLPNGFLQVSGEKHIGLNRQIEVLRLSGIIDPRQIQAGNQVSSSQIADARLEYTGQGYISEAQRMAWLSRFFNTFLPF